VEVGGELSLRRQCELLGINRSSLHYTPVKDDDYTLLLMRLIDEEYTRHPFYGTRRMVHYLRKLGHTINRKRIQNLYGVMGLEAIHPGPNLSKAVAQHLKYPYLLRGVAINRCDQVWSTDLTYVRLGQGFVYLMAVIDWYSRYVLDWELSISLEADFCIETLRRVLKCGKCDIFNTDQGSQFTSEGFTGLLLANDVKISMDGKGRALDNIFVERLWRSVKYESVYLNQWETVQDARTGLNDYFEFYNNERPHQSLNYKTPAEVYHS
jgi:putative transposase